MFKMLYTALQGGRCHRVESPQSLSN